MINISCQLLTSNCQWVRMRVSKRQSYWGETKKQLSRKDFIISFLFIFYLFFFFFKWGWRGKIWLSRLSPKIEISNRSISHYHCFQCFYTAFPQGQSVSATEPQLWYDITVAAPLDTDILISLTEFFLNVLQAKNLFLRKTFLQEFLQLV